MTRVHQVENYLLIIITGEFVGKLSIYYLKTIYGFEDGANILIKNGWLEEPPKAIDRQKLVEQPK